MENRLKLVIPALVLLIVMVITLFVMQGRPQTSPISIPAGAVVYTDQESGQLFLELYGMTSLQQQEVYLYQDDIYIDFWFAKNAGDAEIDSARNFAITRFVLDNYWILGPSPYAPLRNQQDGSELTWQHVICRIYVGSKLAYQDEYDENHQLLP